MTSWDERAYGSYKRFCQVVGTKPIGFLLWNVWGTLMRPEDRAPEQPTRRKNSLFDRRTQPSYLDLTFPSLHLSEKDKSYTVVGPR